MSIATKALWIMERNSDRTLSLSGLAEAAGVSRSHLAHAFGSATGMPAMKYLRARRLGRAAQVLANGAPDILSVALDAGYNSHEAFTRAFRDQFGMTPEHLRERGHVEGLPLAEPLELTPEAGRPPLRPKFADQGEIRAVGLSAPYNFASTIGIPAQWQRFMAVCHEIAHQKEEIPIGIGQLPDEDGQFRYVCAVEVERFGDLPDGLEAIRIPATRYAVFEHNEHVSTLYRTYDRIWNEALPDAGCVVADAQMIERHNPTFNTLTGEGGVTLWIPIVASAVQSPPDASAHAPAAHRNSETVEAYGRYAERYAEATKQMSEQTRDILRHFAESLPSGASILDIGSGPGWDADYLETMGFSVRRTDATTDFVALQRKRGKAAYVLDLVNDDLGGPHDGVLLLYVLQHIDDELLGAALQKISAGLHHGGSVLLTFRTGDGTITEHASSGDYHSTLRRPETFLEVLQQTGLEPGWQQSLRDDEGNWLVVLARRP